MTLLARIATGIEGFDKLTYGGLPANRSTLVAGSSGSGKTILAAQFLVGGILEHDSPGVFVTFEETPADIRANMAGFVFVIASLHLLHVNTRLLPEHIRPPMWRQVGLVAMSLFYGFFVIRSAMALWNA